MSLARHKRHGPLVLLVVIAAAVGGSAAPAADATTDPYAFAMSPTASPFRDATPGEAVALRFRVTNTGTADDTYTFTTVDAGAHQLPVTTPGPLFVPAGDSATTSFILEVPDDVASAMPRVFATSSGDPDLRRQLSWSVRVPVFIELILDDNSPTLREGTAPFGPRGVLHFRWTDGTPAAHLPLSAVHAWMGLEPISERQEGDTGADGTWSFHGLTFTGSGLPGEHTLLVTGTHAGTSHQAGFGWNVQAA